MYYLRYTFQKLKEELAAFGLPFDFLYLPPAKHCTGNLGYAFVNFVCPQDAEYFVQIFEDRIWAKSSSKVGML